MSLLAETKKMEMKMPIEEMVVDKSYILEGITFDLNSHEIDNHSLRSLARVHRMLLKNPSVSVEIGVHTDARGMDDYNLKLAKQRAEEILEKLVEMGAPSNRLRVKGYGETQLLNHCGNDVHCNSPEHLQNRRVELKILDLGKR